MKPPLPNFLIIGAAKCGTTSLFEQLRRHPDVFMPPRRWKEPTFFSERADGRWSRGLDWYASLFRHWRGETAVGEASTSYTKAPVYSDAAHKIAATLPDTRLIYLVREPVAQMISHYRHMRFHRGTRLSFREHVEGDDFLPDCASYAKQLERYLEHFSLDRILVVPFETYVADPEATCGRICRFLGVDDGIRMPLDRPRNVGRGRRLIRRGHSPRLYRGLHRLLPRAAGRAFDRYLTQPIPVPRCDDPVLAELHERMIPEIDALERMTGLSLDCWRAPGWKPGAHDSETGPA